MKRKQGWAIAGVCAVVTVMIIMLRLQQPPDRPRVSRTPDATTTASPYEEMSRFSMIDADRKVIIHCGNSMRVIMEKLAGEFQREHGIAVEFNFGGSAELLSTLEVGRRGDLYICHDPYAEMLAGKELLDEYIVVGRLVPVILVAKGNPLGIGGLEDLAGEGMRVASVDPRYATAGRMVHQVLDQKDWGAGVRKNILIESRGHSDAALSLVTGHVDAAVVWNFLAELYADRVERVGAGVSFPEEIRVTLCRLTVAENTAEALKFMEFAASDFAVQAFRDYGYRDNGADEG